MTMNIPHFTLAYWCVLLAAILPIVCAGIAKSSRGAIRPITGCRLMPRR